MQITILTTNYPPERAPGGKRMGKLAAALQGAGHQVSVVTLAPHYPANEIFEGYGDRWMDCRDESGIEVRRVRPVLASRTALARRAVTDARNAAAQVLASLAGTPDIVVATIPSLPLAPLAACVAGLRAARLVIDVRDLYWLYAGQVAHVARPIIEATERVLHWSFAQADVITTTTSEQGSYLSGNFSQLPAITTAPNGVDEGFFDSFAVPPQPVAGRLRVVYAGLLGYAQGLRVLVEAAKDLGAADWEIIIAGDGPERPMLEELSRRLALPHVRFAGYLTAQGIVDLYRTADILYAQLRSVDVMSTAQPTKVLDYLATGRPVVYGGSGAGARAVNDSGGGTVIPPDEPESIVRAFRGLQDAAHRHATGARGREFVKSRFLWDRLLPAFTQTVVGRS